AILEVGDLVGGGEALDAGVEDLDFASAARERGFQAAQEGVFVANPGSEGEGIADPENAAAACAAGTALAVRLQLRPAHAEPVDAHRDAPVVVEITTGVGGVDDPEASPGDVLAHLDGALAQGSGPLDVASSQRAVEAPLVAEVLVGIPDQREVARW